MKTLFRALFTLGALALCSPPAFSQTVVSPSGSVPVQGTCFGAIGATATCVDASNPLPITIISGGGGGGSGTEYTEDAAAVANPIGGVVQCVRRDTLSASEVSADGYIITIKCTSKGEQVVRDADAVALLTTQAGYLDGLEASLTTIDGRVDGLETAVASTNTKLDTLITDLGTLRTAIGTSASAEDCDGSAALMSYQLCAAIKLAALLADTSTLQTSPHKTSTPVRIVSAAASTNLTEIADSGGCTVGHFIGSVARTTPIYAKFYNAADGSVTVGTTTPYLTIPLPAGGTQPTAFEFDIDQKFASGACSVAFTTAVADNSTAALTAADLLGATITWQP